MGWTGWGIGISRRFSEGDHSHRRATGGRGCRFTTSSELRGREPLKTAPPIFSPLFYQEELGVHSAPSRCCWGSKGMCNPQASLAMV